MTTRLEKAIALAMELHGGTTDKCGQPFVGHPLRVMAYAAAERGVRGDGLVAAVLHDSVEDTDLTLDEIHDQFGVNVANLVDELTRREGETYWQYVDRVAGGSITAIQVKLADLSDNMDPRRVVPEFAAEFSGMVSSRYRRARNRLLDEIESRMI